MVNTEATNYVCGLRREDFQTIIDGKRTDLYILKNAKGNEIAFTNYGGAIVAIIIPDRDGNLANIIQGHDNIHDVINSPEPYLSTLIGRYSNRIAKGHFQLDGKEYNIAINNGPNSLHGGKKGFNTKVWDAVQINEHAVVLKYTSPYGEEGFTGEVEVWVAYSFTDDDELIIKYSAKTNKKTIINLTNHGFFSLAGIANPTPTIEDLECQINADFYIPIDETSIPTGEVLKVAGTPFDFRQPKLVGQDIDAEHEQIKIGGGYDHCFVLNKKEEGELSFAARIKDPKSGRIMEVFTTEPGLQVYTDNGANGYKGQNGATFPRRSAICFEAQHFPDSPNHPYFPSVILEPCREYKQKTIYKFGVEK
ncbi:aldose epimerase family protein [Prevotella pallens]|uniref:aldose epimerase family protein n=1 Tax=Prevotella pallens TaxID=60133 RepID=UPI001CAAA955|nr:aldose epimerase family protein [Prevotella pallens]MBF1516838.1 galactose mutarotase [Prevotella pallens]